MKTLTMLAGAILFFHYSFGQPKPRVYLGLGAGSSSFVYKYEELKPMFSASKPGRNLSLHFSFMYAINEHWLFETGLGATSIASPVMVETLSGKYDPGIWMIPVRMNYKVNVIPEKLDLMFYAGYVQGLKMLPQDLINGTDDFLARHEFSGEKWFPLADLGARINMPLGRFHLGLAGTYTKGFSDIYIIQARFTDGPALGYPTIMTSKGTQFNLKLEAFYGF